MIVLKILAGVVVVVVVGLPLLAAISGIAQIVKRARAKREEAQPPAP